MTVKYIQEFAVSLGQSIVGYVQDYAPDLGGLAASTLLGGGPGLTYYGLSSILCIGLSSDASVQEDTPILLDLGCYPHRDRDSRRKILNMSAKKVDALVKALENNMSLTPFRPDGSAINPQGLRKIFLAFESNTIFETLFLRSQNITPMLACDLARSLQNNTTLTCLHLGENSISTSPEGFNPFDALLASTTLKSLCLDSNGLDMDGVRDLSVALMNNIALTALSLRGNQIGPDGTIYLAEALREGGSLKYLDLGNTGIGPDGAFQIGEALKQNRTLARLDLSYNEMGPDGAFQIGEALKQNTTLVRLDLSHNEMGSEGAVHLAHALLLNISLITLYLLNNAIGIDGSRHLSEALKVNGTLTDLCLLRYRLPHSYDPDIPSDNHISALDKRNLNLCILRNNKTRPLRILCLEAIAAGAKLAPRKYFGPLGYLFG